MAAGLAGTLDASRVLSAQASAGSFLTFTVLTGIIVGGTSIMGGEGSVQRTVVGCLFVALVANGFNLLGLDPFYQQVTLGIILLLAVGTDAWSRAAAADHGGRRTESTRITSRIDWSFADSPLPASATARPASPGRSSSARRRARSTRSSRPGRSRRAAGSSATSTRSRRRCTCSRASSLLDIGGTRSTGWSRATTR